MGEKMSYMDLLMEPEFNTKRLLRLRAMMAYGYQCVYCGGEGDHYNGDDGRPWQLDRIYPGVLGGEYRADNVALSCATCNIQKKDTPGGRGTRWECNALDAQEHFADWDYNHDIQWAQKKSWIRENTKGAVNDNEARP
jgi:hypothetical protein